MTYSFNKKASKVSEEKQYKLQKEYWQEGVELYQSLTQDYTTSIKTAREWSDLTREEIAENADIEIRHLDRVLKGQVKKTETFIRVFLAMKLPPMVTTKLLELAPCEWTLSNPKHAMYNWAINSMEGSDLEEIKERLEALGYPLC